MMGKFKSFMKDFFKNRLVPDMSFGQGLGFFHPVEAGNPEKEVRVSWEWDKTEQGAEDRGSGPEFPSESAYMNDVAKRIATESGKIELRAPVIKYQSLVITLPPEVLAQLQRIETLLARIWREVAPSSESDVNTLLPDE